MQSPENPASTSFLIPGRFHQLAHGIAKASGRPMTFLLAVLIVVGWALAGPYFHFSDTWQLFINTFTTLITFLMVFLIQNSQNRDTEAVQLKLDELLRATHNAHNALLDLEDLSEEEMEEVKARFGELARKARDDIRSGRADFGSPEVTKPESERRSLS